MKLSQLLIQRETLLWRAHLAGRALAYRQLDGLVTRLAGARLRGRVCLQPADPGAERFWPVLTALDSSQSVIEEHFTDENIVDLADLLLSEEDGGNVERVFHLEQMAAEFLAPLRRQLEDAGVEIDIAEASPDGRGNGPVPAGSNRAKVERPRDSL